MNKDSPNRNGAANYNGGDGAQQQQQQEEANQENIGDFM